MRKYAKVWSGSEWVPRPAKAAAFTNTVVQVAEPLNPYAGVDWGNAEYIIGGTHMHSKQNGTTSTEEEMFDLSYNAGIRSMAWSNYYDEESALPMASYFGISIPGDAVGLDNSEQHRLTDTNLHYSPLGSTQARFGTYSTPVSRPNTWRSMFAEALALMNWPDAGGIILNHPQWTSVQNGGMTVEELCEMLDYDKRVLGIEAYNHKTEALDNEGWALDWWDEILSTGRRCWGFFATDGYDERITPPALGFSVLLIDENTAYKAAKAYREGHFYGVLQAGSTLRFENIEADTDSVSVEVNETANITFYTEDGLAQTNTSTTSATYNVISNQVFVRVEAINASGDRIFSQPVMYNQG